ncbi:MAG: sulfite exporter TauE/SafE family protein [Pyrinomonadaceae bacterium]
MRQPVRPRRPRRRSFTTFFIALLLGSLLAPAAALAHPLGNFTVNHYSRLEVGAGRVRVRYVVDMAEIAAFQELPQADSDGDGRTSEAELEAYARRVAPEYANNLTLVVDGAHVPLNVVGQKISLPPGQGGLPLLRIECDFEGAMPAAANGGAPRRLAYADGNHADRIGWHEIVIAPASGVAVFNSNAYGNGITNELREYPEDQLAAPLNERTAELSFTMGAPPADAVPLRTRDGKAVATARDRFAELIGVPELTPGVALLGLLFATVLGGFHALSPGHGKAVVAAYLVGSRGTAKHAAFLGLTVTITHTAGVIALGLVTLFASQYILPETLYPVLSLVSAAIVVVVGLSLLWRRSVAVFGLAPHEHHHHHGHEHIQQPAHEHSHGHDHSHDHAHPHPHDHADHSQHNHEHPQHGHSHSQHAHGDDAALTHTHDGSTHSHLPPGTDGTPVTWRSLLALGVSGGLLPCPSALVVMLSAINLHRVGYGLVLVLAFSVGLAGVLTGIGLAFVYARRFVERPLAKAGWALKVLPVLSAAAITAVGLLLFYEAFAQGGAEALASAGSFFAHGDEEISFASKGALAILGFGLIYGLRHATEVDHVVAVSTIVSEHRKLWRSALVGGLWGAGHTASLVLVGALVLALRVAIPERVGEWLEFSVALMIIALGVLTFARSLRGRASVHVHQHQHEDGGGEHAHVHFHEPGAEHEPPAAAVAHTHTVSRIGLKPLVVGAVHGLAGSAALTILVLTQIESTMLGLLYLSVFGLGSIAGMMLMSGLIGLPFAYGTRRLAGFHRGLQTIAGALSIAFGLWYAYEKGIANGLLAAVL